MPQRQPLGTPNPAAFALIAVFTTGALFWLSKKRDAQPIEQKRVGQKPYRNY